MSGNLLAIVPCTIQPFPRCPKPFQGKGALKTGIILPVCIPPQAENTTNNRSNVYTTYSTHLFVKTLYQICDIPTQVLVKVVTFDDHR